MEDMLFSLAAAAALAVAGCGGDDEGTSESAGSEETAAVSEDGEVLIADFRYDPEDITVEVDQPVTFLNNDDAPHTATADGEGSFDTGRLEKKDEGELTFDEAGTYAYFCEFHPFMKGSIDVVEG